MSTLFKGRWIRLTVGEKKCTDWKENDPLQVKLIWNTLKDGWNSRAFVTLCWKMSTKRAGDIQWELAFSRQCSPIILSRMISFYSENEKGSKKNVDEKTKKKSYWNIFHWKKRNWAICLLAVSAVHSSTRTIPQQPTWCLFLSAGDRPPRAAAQLDPLPEIIGRPAQSFQSGPAPQVFWHSTTDTGLCACRGTQDWKNLRYLRSERSMSAKLSWKECCTMTVDSVPGSS